MTTTSLHLLNFSRFPIQKIHRSARGDDRQATVSTQTQPGVVKSKKPNRSASQYIAITSVW